VVKELTVGSEGWRQGGFAGSDPSFELGGNDQSGTVTSKYSLISCKHFEGKTVF
jgi:hypothetical protein